jgi:DNA-binding XRE family transcriptional regulator
MQIKKMISMSQIKAARGLLDWSQSVLAQKANLTQRTLTNIETGRTRPNTDTLIIIKKTLEEHGVDFIEDGVRHKKRHMDIIKGNNFQTEFLDFIYDVLCSTGTKEVLLNGINQDLLTGLARAHVVDYTQKIKSLNVKERFIVPENMDRTFMTVDLEHYRGLPPEYFSDSTPIVIFDSYYAMMLFDIQEIWVIKNKGLAEFQRKQFAFLWDNGKSFI